MAISLRKNNPYSKGRIQRFIDKSPPLLERDTLVYTPTTEDEYHTLTEGETLDSLAHKFYGDSKLYWAIADANEIENPLDLSAITSLIIPSIDKVNLIF